ncbi:MAG: hypothetical protein RsTaC01_1101 [Candidatus Paraimprobicoccus trichonymphae]|uniref:Uncharacterized protein n=1 Tax=Candidatus Paraimprobicoccus trichonymphae TaxID=3033793 RepID=A0AA48KZQ8_9FIRM|nr:MAG: hypothetical protein RsTaC01_1101 [Candidatus Paraimprobicoccus trichonymphae]
MTINHQEINTYIRTSILLVGVITSGVFIKYAYNGICNGINQIGKEVREEIKECKEGITVFKKEILEQIDDIKKEIFKEIDAMKEEILGNKDESVVNRILKRLANIEQGIFGEDGKFIQNSLKQLLHEIYSLRINIAQVTAVVEQNKIVGTSDSLKLEFIRLLTNYTSLFTMQTNNFRLPKDEIFFEEDKFVEFLISSDKSNIKRLVDDDTIVHKIYITANYINSIHRNGTNTQTPILTFLNEVNSKRLKKLMKDEYDRVFTKT